MTRVDAAWVAARAAVADPETVMNLVPGAVDRMDRLLRAAAQVFAERRADVVSGEFTHGSRGLHPDESSAFLRGVDGGQLAIDEAGYVTLPCAQPKPGQTAYALCCKNGNGVTVNLEYVIQLGAVAEFSRDLGWPREHLRVELGEFDASIVDGTGRPLVVMEAKCRVTGGSDTLEQLLLKWLKFAAAPTAPEPGRGRNAEHKYLELLRLTSERPSIEVLLAAAGARWWLTAERGEGHVLRFYAAQPMKATN